MPTNIWSKLTNLDNFEDIIHEMTKKYRHTIMKIVSDKTVAYGKYAGYKDKYHTFYDLYDNPIRLSDDTDAEVRIWYPKRGLYNVNFDGYTGVLYYTRTANRQYRRGMNDDNTTLIDPMGAAYGHMRKQFSLHYLQQIAENKRDFRHLDEVIHAMSSSNTAILSYAFNDRWAVSLPIDSELIDKYDLWLYRHKVGHIQNNTIYFTDATFKQELIDENNKDWYAGYYVQ